MRSRVQIRSVVCFAGQVLSEESRADCQRECRERCGSWARWIHPRGTLCHARCLLATPSAQTTTQGNPSAPPLFSPCPKTPFTFLTTKTKRKKKKKKRHFNISNVTFWPLYHSSFFRFFLIFFWPYVLPTQFFIRIASTKEMYITVSNFRYDLQFFPFSDIPSSLVFSLFFLATIYPYFISVTKSPLKLSFIISIYLLRL